MLSFCVVSSGGVVSFIISSGEVLSGVGGIFSSGDHGSNFVFTNLYSILSGSGLIYYVGITLVSTIHPNFSAFSLD